MSFSSLSKLPARTAALAACLAGALLWPVSAQAAGDLLVAPTRVVMDGAGGTEIILNNIGAAPATYRVSLEVKRMKGDGQLEDVPEASVAAAEQAALDMVSYSPRRVTLPPNQPQIIRIGLRPPAELPDGEYRVHMLFRAIPDATTPTQSVTTGEGLSINLQPIYGVTIPVIVRKGDLKAMTALSNPRIEQNQNGAALAFDMTRQGTGSLYGEVRVFKPGVAEPLVAARGIAIYPEVNARQVSIPIPAEAAAALKGPVTIQYIQDREQGGATLASIDAVLR